MLSGYDFSNCNIPVRFNHFFFLLVNFWSGCEGSPKNSLISDAVLWKALLWGGSNTVKMQLWLDNKRVPSPYRSPNGKLWKTEIFWIPKTFRELKPDEQVKIFSPLLSLSGTVCFFVLFFCDVAETRSTNMSAASLMAGLHCAPGMRREGNQSNQSNRRPPQWHWREQRGGWGGGVGVMWLQTF